MSINNLQHNEEYVPFHFWTWYCLHYFKFSWIYATSIGNAIECSIRWKLISFPSYSITNNNGQKNCSKLKFQVAFAFLHSHLYVSTVFVSCFELKTHQYEFMHFPFFQSVNQILVESYHSILFDRFDSNRFNSIPCHTCYCSVNSERKMSGSNFVERFCHKYFQKNPKKSKDEILKQLTHLYLNGRKLEEIVSCALLIQCGFKNFDLKRPVFVRSVFFFFVF